MKYTYQISFNGSDYSTLYPNTDLEMSGGWETGTMIWREKISEMKITKALNSTVYNTLESYFEDDTYFETRIYIKILKNAVQDSLHWFGIKWGKLDKHHTTYTVEPESYDLWARYFIVSKDLSLGGDTYNFPDYYYFDTVAPYSYMNYTSTSNTTNVASFRRKLVGLLYPTTWPTSDIASTFLFGDDYEDSTPLGTVKGVKEDYTTGLRSWMHGCGASWPRRMSFSDYLNRLLIFNVYAYFDTNNKLRLEHIKFFNDKLNDNDVDFSSYLTDQNETYSYESSELPISETFTMGSNEEDDDEDFIGASIVYSTNRNRPDAMIKDISYEWYSNLEFIHDNSITDINTIYSATSSKAYEWFNIDMNSASDGVNYLVINYTLGQFCGSNDFFCGLATAYPLTVEVNSISGDVDIFIKDRSSGAAMTNAVNVSSTGTTTGTLTATATGTDAYLTIEAKSSGAMSCTIKLEEPNLPNNLYQDVPTMDAIVTGDLKSNAAFSHGNIFHNWWQDNRISRDASYNGSDYLFNATNYNLRRDTMKFHYSGVINPLYGFNDGTRVGKIDKWKRSLDTDFYEIDIIYEEDE